MKNFPIVNPEDNKEYWISRAIAVVVIFTAVDKSGDKYILAVQRGSGTPDPEFIGSYCLPCGYLDYNETCVEAAARELKEETGIEAPISAFELIAINDNPYSDKRQNVTFRYKVHCNTSVEELRDLITDKFSEEDEVSSIEFISLADIEEYKWAFNHKELIKGIYDNINIRH